MKLIQLNIWGGKFINQMAAFFGDEKPDIVCMQEVHEMPGLTNYLFGPLHEIKELSNFSESFMAPYFEFNYMNRKTSYGNAILSQQKARNTKTIFTRGQFTKNYDTDTAPADQEPYNFLHVELENGLHVLTYHGLYVPGSKAGNDETLVHTQMIIDYIQTLPGPVILTGDLNLTPDSPTIQLLDKSLRNLSAENNLTNTYNQFGMHAVVCDYIFVNDKVKVKSFAVSEALVSDHKPLILEFDI